MKTIGKKIFFILVGICFFSPATSFSLDITAGTDKDTLALNESLILTINVSGDGANSANLTMPAMSNFAVYSSGRSSQISIINGRISSSISYTYVLTPKYIGKTQIPPISVFTGKEKYLTKSIDIIVTSAKASQNYQNQPKPSASNRPDKNTPLESLVFVKAETDKKKAYPGEQITFKFRFYTAIPISRNPEYYAPALENLTAEDLPPVRNGDMVINNVRYYYSEMKTAFFPINSGKASIGNVELIAQIQRQEDIDPFDPNFMQKFFSGFTNFEEMRLKTKKQTIEIEPLPEPMPADFSQAVGNFFIAADTDRKEAKQGEPINLTVKINGKGNMKYVSVPDINDPKIKIYDKMSSYSLTKHDDIVGGEKKITYVLAFKEAGEMVIPPVKFTFFNVDTKKYETIETSPVKMKILKAEANKAFDFSQSQNESKLQVKGTDIKYINLKNSANTAKIAWTVNKFSFYAHGLFLILVILSFFKNRSNLDKIKNPLSYAFKNAKNVFLNALKEAQRESAGSNHSKALAVIYDAVMDYLSAKIGENIYSLTIEKIKEKFLKKFPQSSEFTIMEIKSTLEEIEFLNYAPSSLNNEKIKQTAERAKNLCEIIEKEAQK